LKSTCTGSLAIFIDNAQIPFNLIFKKKTKGGKNLPPLKNELLFEVGKTES
jgi:hypothetical protein